MSETYGVIDLAAAAPLRARVARLNPPEGTFLMDRSASDDLVSFGPWLINIRLCPVIESYWIRDGQWKNWGYLIETDLSMAALQRHLKKFNLVEIEGRSDAVFFRYFDPVVLKSFLQEIADEDQRKAFLGPIETIVIADSKLKQTIRIPGHAKH